MGSLAIACYKPRPGCAQALLALVKSHQEPLLREGLVTARKPIIARAADGTIIEIFEWASQEAIRGAHSNPVVQEMWKRFEALATYEVPANIAEFKTMFAHFEPLNE